MTSLLSQPAGEKHLTVGPGPLRAVAYTQNFHAFPATTIHSATVVSPRVRRRRWVGPTVTGQASMLPGLSTSLPNWTIAHRLRPISVTGVATPAVLFRTTTTRVWHPFTY